MTSNTFSKQNSSNILETARSIILNSTSKDSETTKAKNTKFLLNKDAQKLAIINKTIIKTKECLKSETNNDTTNIFKNLKTHCLEQKILFHDQLKNIKTNKDLLNALHVLRKNTKLNLFNKNKNPIDLSASSHELLASNSKYTINNLCKEFSCKEEKINNEFIENKKALCFCKIELLLSQHNYCNILTDNINEINTQNGYKLENKDFPKIKKGLDFTFDQICELAEKTIDDDVIDLNKNTLVLGTLSYFKSKIIKDIDKQCNKVDLANTYLASLEKTQTLNLE